VAKPSASRRFWRLVVWALLHRATRCHSLPTILTSLFTSGDQVADVGDATVITTPDGEQLQCKGRPDAILQEVFQTLKIAWHVAVDQRDPDI